MVGKRRNMMYGKSKEYISKNAGVNKMHRKNSWSQYNMRGGIRL